MQTNQYLEKLTEWLKTHENNHTTIPFFMEESSQKTSFLPANPIPQIRQIIAEIIQGFDIASYTNFIGDTFRFYYRFSDVLFKAIQIHIITEEFDNDWENPENPIKHIENEFDRKFIETMFPTIGQEDTNIIKRNFLDWFEQLIEMIQDKYTAAALPLEQKLINKALNAIYDRDFLYNFRQADHTSNLFRSPDPGRFFDENGLLTAYIKKNNITQIIDLRGDREAKKSPNQKYLKLLKDKNVAHLIVDFNEPGAAQIPDEDVAKTLERVEGYVRKLIFLKDSIKATFEAIATTEGAALFHCASGKDRTGVMAAILQKFIGLPEEIIILDYTRSGQDCRRSRIESVLNYIERYGGIQKFIDDCDIRAEIQARIKAKLMR
jgi:protein tyrosine/serine phosphatase